MNMGFIIKENKIYSFSLDKEEIEEVKLGQYYCKVCGESSYWVRCLTESYHERMAEKRIALSTLEESWKHITKRHPHDFEWSIILTKMGINK